MRIRPLLFFFVVTWLLGSTAAHALGYNGVRGLWYDRAHPGHGIDVETIGATTFVVLYTFDASGEPEWYTAQGALQTNTLDAELLRFRYDSAAHATRLDASVGRLALHYDAHAGDGACAGSTDRSNASELAELTFNIGAETIAWCVEPLIPPQTQPATAMSGLWWGGAGDAGWGLGSYFIAQPGAAHSVHVLYHYDAAGHARWVIGDSADADFDLALEWISYRGYCRTCAPTALQSRPGGSLALRLVAPLVADNLANHIELHASYPGGGAWDRSGNLSRISDAFAPPLVALTREGIVAPDVFLQDGASVQYFGIPYAAPPTGANRFRAPQPALPRYAVMDVTRLAPGCPQDITQAYFGAAPASLSEDCLTLNVWTPRLPSGPRLPVMVWIHGGGFVQGGSLNEQPAGSHVFSYDGGNFARRNVIFVSMNYRLGALGFGAFRELAGEHADYPSSGNYGFLDQVAALRWVRDNIAQFGGDPSNVTIFGESAGGVSVCGHMASPLSRGLFARAIMESGNCLQSMSRLLTSAQNAEPAYAQGDRIEQRLGCSGAGDVPACLRSKSVDEIVAATQGTVGFGRSGENYSLRIDGFAFDRTLAQSIADGSAAALPFIIGINQDEASSLVPAEQRPQTAAGYEALVRSKFALIADQVLARYPASAYSPVWRAYTAIVTDLSFICPAERAARDHASRGNAAYAYYFTQTLPQQPDLGAFHGIEIPFLFGLVTLPGAGSNELADRMREDWTTFARIGIPSAAGQVTWPQHPVSATLGLRLDGAGDSAVAGYRQSYCDFWAQYLTL